MKKPTKLEETEATLRTMISELQRKQDAQVVKLGKVCEYIEQLTGEHPCRATKPPSITPPTLSRWQHFKALFTR